MASRGLDAASVAGSSGELASSLGQLGSSGTVVGLLLARAEATSEAPFIMYDGSTVSYADAVGRASVVASSLSALGVRSGDSVLVMLGNCLEYIDTWFATALLGAVLVPVNTALVGEGLSYITDHSEAEVAVVASEFAAAFDTAAPSRVRVRISVGHAPPGWISFDEVVRAGGAFAPVALQPGDTASILYTSGTTGLPKGVVNCHNSYVTAGLEFAKRTVQIRADDVLMTSLPLFHVNAQMLSVMGSVVSGRPLVLLPRFSASRFMEQAREHGATVFNYIGAMLTMLFKQPPSALDAISRLRLAVGGAAPAEIWEMFESRFNLDILEIYGLTETATFCLSSQAGASRVGSIGMPVSWSEVDVHDEDGKPVADGAIGEIVVRSKREDVLFKGYLKDPDATAEALREGWFHTGDRGSRDSDGYFRFVDRMKDSIRRRGENISSYEIEQVVNLNPAVAESAVVGVPSDLGEEDVLIAVVVKQELDPAALVEWCRPRLAAFMVPRYVRVVDSLPKTATQRIQKFILREAGVDGAWDREAPDVKWERV